MNRHLLAHCTHAGAPHIHACITSFKSQAWWFTQTKFNEWNGHGAGPRPQRAGEREKASEKNLVSGGEEQETGLHVSHWAFTLVHFPPPCHHVYFYLRFVLGRVSCNPD